ncbi:MAG TPA: hypothetical protein DCQ28_12840 [Bacteroidetes bacterium]|nr:hypothetical protein [Bacteroidota bacterium]
MRKIVFSILLLVVGCAEPVDQASTNLKKGDEFFAKNEYEVAEYYYDKIPEDSPFFRQAQKKLNVIAAVKEKWKIDVGDTVEISKVTITENKYTTDNDSKSPIHTLTVVNTSWKKLKRVNIEFSYFTEAGIIITRLVVNDVELDLDPNTQKVYENISPGTIYFQFATCEAKIINAYFQ